jgi:hypothetical protein
MSDLPRSALEWLATHHGVITSAVLRQHGVRRSTAERLADREVLHRVSAGVFVDQSVPQTLDQRCAVLCATHPSGFVTGPTAGAMAGLRRMPATAALHFAVRHGIHIVETPGVRWRQTTAIPGCDRRVRDDGIVVASWARLSFDLAADLPQLDHLSVVHQLLDQRRVTADELVAIEQRLGHPGRAGSGAFRRTLVSLGGRDANDSHPEVVLAERLRALAVPVVHQARVIRSSGGRVFHVDLAVPQVRWGIELDIHPEHRSIEGHASDAQRRREMHRLAWQVETVAEHDMAEPEHLARELAALYRMRCRQLASHPSTA